jgi:hypothetical protein
MLADATKNLKAPIAKAISDLLSINLLANRPLAPAVIRPSNRLRASPAETARRPASSLSIPRSSLANIHGTAAFRIVPANSKTAKLLEIAL